MARPLWVEEERPTLTGCIGKFLDAHEEYEELATFRRLSMQDSLTKLRNHMSARKVIEAALAHSDNRRYALLLFDLDHFKSANDRFGHLFGDDVLKAVAHKVLRSIRSEDVAARVGGDEFLIFMAYTIDQVEPLIQRIFTSLTGTYRDFPISLSLGVALAPEHGTDYETLFNRADQALYAAKKNGRNQYRLYNSSIQGYLSVLSPIDSDSAQLASQP